MLYLELGALAFGPIKMEHPVPQTRFTRVILMNYLAELLLTLNAATLSI